MHFARVVRLTVLVCFASSLVALAGPNENRTLFQAVSRGDKAAVEKALKYGGDPNARMIGGKTALQLAEDQGLTEIAGLLRAGGASPAPAVQPPKEEAAPPAVVVEETKREEIVVAPTPEPEAEPEPQPAPTTVVTAPPAAKLAVAEVKKSDPSASPKPAAAKPPPPASSDLQQFLDQNGLQNDYNGIVVDYLVEEGRNSLAPEQRKQALDQLVAAMKAKTQVTPDEQLYTALGALVGMGMGAADSGTVVADAGEDVESSYASEYDSWVDAAFKLVHAGYSEDGASFFEYGLKYIPYPGTKARCVKGLAAARPDVAYDFLMAQTKAPGIEEQNAALRLLGWLAVDPNLPDDKRQAILDKLTEFSQGMMHASNYGAAIHGLDVANDKRAVPALSRFKGGLGIATEDKRPALRSLLLTYKDESVLEILRKMTKGGLMTLNDPWDNLFAARVLIQYGDESGFTWADQTLAKTRKGFMDSKDAPDHRPETVRILVAYGGEKGLKVLAQNVDKYRDDDWLKTWIATGMLELGDKSRIDLVRASLNNPEWDYTAVRITEALAKHDDLSGLPVLQQLIEKHPPKKSTGMQLLGALAGQKDNTKDENRRLGDLRIQIANALARINRPECVPLLSQLLRDEDIYVRSAAALALTEIASPQALEGLTVAMDVDYGTVDKRSRNPEVYAHVARLAALRFPSEPRTAEIVKKAAGKPYPAVQFLAAVLQI